VFYWLRLCRGTEDKTYEDDLKKSCAQLLTLEGIATVAVRGGPHGTDPRLPTSVRCGPSASVRGSVRAGTLAAAPASRP
jgi:hypothetical protein